MSESASGTTVIGRQRDAAHGSRATSGTDYTAVSDFTVTIPRETASGTGTFTLTPTQDDIAEGDETIDITGTADDFTVTKAEMTLTDDETAPASITLTTSPTSLGEDDDATTVTVTATLGGSATLLTATEVTVSVGGGSATSGTDYTAVSDFTVTIPKETASGSGTFTLTPVQDSIAEGDETIDVTGTADGFTVTKAEMMLTDDVPQRTVSFDKQVFTVTEGTTRQVLMQVDLSGPLDREVTIPLTTTHGSGVEANDYVLAVIGVEDYYAGNDTWTSIDGDLVFAPAETAKIVQVTAVDDSIVEDDEILELGFGTLPEGISPGSIQVARVTITDNDSDSDDDDGDNDGDNDGDGDDDDANRAPAFTSPVSFSVAENRTAVGTVVASDSDDADSITGYALAGGADRALFSIDSATGAFRFLTPPNHEEPADADSNNVSAVVVEATSGTGDRARTAQQTITVTVTNADEQPERPAAPGVDPTAGSTTDLDVSWTEPGRNGGPAIAGYELRYRPGGGAWSNWPHAGTGTSTVIEGLETDTSYQVQVRALNGETPGEWSPSGMARTPNPPPARVRNVSIVNGPGSDGVWSAGERVEVEVVYPVPVVVEKPEDCWSYNADGTCRESGPFVLVVFRDDARPGYGKSLSTPLAPYVGGSGTATLRFDYTVGEDEDGARRVEPADNGILLRGATIRTLEGGEGKPEYTNTRVMQVTVERSGRAWTAGEKVRVRVRFTGPAQYTPPDDPENLDEVVVDETGGVPTIRVLLGDRVERTLERTATYVSGSGKDTLVFEYEVTAGDGRVGAVEVVADSLAKNGATIRNKDGYDAELDHLGEVQYAQRAALSVADAEATEGEDATLDFVVKLDGVPGADDVTVAYRTRDDTAKAGSDYEETSGTLRFSRGEGVYEKKVEVLIIDDDEADDRETFKLLLSNVTGASVKNYEAVGTIRNDEAQETETESESETKSESKPETPTVDVADARVREAAGATLNFVVTLSGASTDTVTVDYRTVDASAKAGEDYTKREDTLTFDPGETSKTIRVTVLDDAHDEGEEKMALVLYRSSSATRADYLGVGTIENTDPMPKAWLARFGRTVSGQVLDAVEERLRASRMAGVTVSVAGQTIDLTAQPDVKLEAENETQARLPVLSDWLRQETNNGDRAGMQSRTVTLAELLMRSSFAVAGETDDGSSAAVWGRMAQSSFSGREAGISLDGDVTTGLLGADYARGSWTGGAVLSHSSGEGGYSGDATGKVKASMTAMAPWAGYSVTDRLSVWGALGYGTGDLTLTSKNPKTQKDQPAQKTDIAMTLAAAGVRGTLVDGDGPKLDAVADARWVRTTSEKVIVSAENGGNLWATQANVTRVRLGLEGSWAMALDDKRTTLTPRFSFGVRRDGGDAETGFGADIGGGLTFAMPASGLMLSLEGRGLIIHEADGLSDTGYQASVGYDPAPSSDLGLSLSLRQSFGGSATGGKDTLFSRELMDGLTANGNDGGSQRLEGKIGYGMPAFGDRFTSTPEFGFAVSGTERTYSLGWRLSREGLDAGTFQSSLEATRRESANDNDPEHGIGFRFTARF